ncbi:MAG: DUF4388 domain-containing protein [Holophagaceae bacterium]|nr:DUF4388 domain-containing protein [Holophagaceae bacterium]
MALLGSIQDFNLFSIFNMIKFQNKIGTLVVQDKDTSVTIIIDSGLVVGIDSNKHDMEGGLVLNLMRLGLISLDEMQNLTDLHAKTLKSIKNIALETNLTTLQNIHDALTMQVMSVVCPLFNLTAGSYRFDSAITTEVDKKIFPAISLETILIEAAKYVDEWPQVIEHLPDFSQFLAKTPTPKLDIEAADDGTAIEQASEEKLTHEEEIIINSFEPPNSIKEVVSTSRYSELDTCKHIANLINKKLLRLYEQDFVQTPSMMIQISDIKKKQMKMFLQSSAIFWPSVAVFILVPIFTYFSSVLGNPDMGMASICPSDKIVQSRQTEERLALVTVLVNAESNNGRLGVQSDFVQNEVINGHIKLLFDRYQSDPLQPALTNRSRTR